ncbi:MAG: thermonuclease family protein [Neisseriaceae bacterium]|nr:thermonuclease family protein [Neisseriaceae bacterium]
MKLFLLGLYLLPFVAWAQTQCFVVKVSDGDSFSCRLDNHKIIQVRLAEIDAPENGQAYSNLARKKLNSLIYKKNVYLYGESKDKYNRRLATVFLPSSNSLSGRLNINLTMIESGFAWHYKRYSNNPQYAAAQTQAQKQKLGLWADNGKIIKPEEWRHR